MFKRLVILFIVKLYPCDNFRHTSMTLVTVSCIYNSSYLDTQDISI